MMSTWISDSLTSTCFFGCDRAFGQVQLDGGIPVDVELIGRIEEAIKTVMRGVDNCSRFIVSSVGGFETLCIKILLGRVMQNDEFIQGLSEVELFLVLPPDSRLDESIKTYLSGWLPPALKLPVVVRPYTVDGGQADRVAEMLELSDRMICFLPDGASEQNKSALSQAQNLGLPVINVS